MTDVSILRQIAIGKRGRLWRPTIGWQFQVWIDPAFDVHEARLLSEMLVQAETVSSHQVSFVWVMEEASPVRIIKDGSREIGQAYAGIVYPNIQKDVVKGAEVVLHPDWVVPRVILHEFGHVLGMADCEVRESTMGGANVEVYPDIDYEAWNWMATQAVGGPSASSAASDQMPVIVCGG